jgi:CO dehydrogenase maturation factor
VRVAVAGKGGAGKTTVSALIARLSARQGRTTVAIDADANPNLGIALGLGTDELASLSPVPASTVSRRLAGPRLSTPVTEVVAGHAAIAPDGVHLLLMGSPQHAGEGCMCSAHAVVSAVLADFGDCEDQVVVVDMEASPEHLSRGTVRHVDLALLVAEPYYRSLETVSRMSRLVDELGVPSATVVANKVRCPDDEAAVMEFCRRHDLCFAGAVPWSDAVVSADRERVPVIDWPHAAPVVDAVAALVAGFSPGRPERRTVRSSPAAGR